MKFKTVPKNYGLIIEEPKAEDFVFGAERSLGSKFAGREILQPDGNWEKYLPDGEPQNINYETQCCVTYSTLNALETLRNRAFDIGENLSDRFVGVGSETNPNGGNTMQKVAEFIRQNWSVFETEYPVPSTLQEFFQKIPNKYYVLAEARGTKYDYGYEQVNLADVPEALKYSPVAISVPAWVQDADGLYYRPEGMGDNHAVMCYGMKNGNYLIEDSYPPYKKEVRADVRPAVRMGYYLKKKDVSEPAYSNWIDRLLAWFKTKLGAWK